MSKAYEFLKECASFFVLTINGDYPTGRPFGAVMEVDDVLYLSTSDTKQVYQQLLRNEHIQIVAQKPYSREWIRITGTASECDSLDLKKRMLMECPVLQKHFSVDNMEHFALIKVIVENVEIN